MRPVRLNEELSTANRRKGSVFSARVEKPVTVDGRVVVPVGALAYWTAEKIVKDYVKNPGPMVQA